MVSLVTAVYLYIKFTYMTYTLFTATSSFMQRRLCPSMSQNERPSSQKGWAPPTSDIITINTDTQEKSTFINSIKELCQQINNIYYLIKNVEGKKF